ncbi:MAG: MmgE/PrpD family protein [Candidatus Eisenbacteria bacterium]|nr:MmgE/PrpD family protein [Candidatus Eisenbacteria bacterium]
MSVAEQISEFGLSLKLEQIPEAVRLRAKGCILDTLGVCLASAHFDFAAMVADVVLGMDGKKESTVIGWGAKVPKVNAALVNGSLAHGADYDDTHGGSRLHPSASVVPAALAVSEAIVSDGRSTLEAVVVGLETVTRIGMSGVSAAGFHQRGIHPTTLCGGFAAALVAGKLLGLDVERSAWALGIAGGMASGLFEYMAEGTWGKRIGPGWAAHGGIIAAELAKKGFSGPRTVFEGKAGLYRSHLGEGNYDLDQLTKGLGEEWQTLSIAAKRFPCCHRNQIHVGLALGIQAQQGIKGSEIAEVQCGVDRLAPPLVCEPWIEKQQPRDGYAAKFSLPYCVAAALSRGRLTMQEFEPAVISDKQVLGLAKRTSYFVDETLDPVRFPGWLKIRMKDGRILEARREREELAGWPEIRTKFLENVSPKLRGGSAIRVVEMVERLERLSDVTELMDLCLKA